jgi:hypothetical protein
VEPSENFTGDLRFAFSNLDTRALYFVIPRDVEANPFSSFTTPPNANDVTSPIQVDNPGVNTRDLYTTSLVDLAPARWLVSYNNTKEVLTGDASTSVRPQLRSTCCSARPQPEPGLDLG